MKGVLALLGEKDTTWKNIKKLLKKNIMGQMKTYDKDNISPEVLTKARKFIANPKFTEANVKKCSMPAAVMCNWVISMVTYSDLNARTREMREEHVALQEQAQVMEASLAEQRAAATSATTELEQAQKRLAEIVAEVQTLQSQL